MLGVRLLDGRVTSSLEASAFNVALNMTDIMSISWGPKDDGQTTEGPRTFTYQALVRGVTEVGYTSPVHIAQTPVVPIGTRYRHNHVSKH